MSLSDTEEVGTGASLTDPHPSVRPTEIFRVTRGEIGMVQDTVAVEEPLEIQLGYGATRGAIKPCERSRREFSITIVGFLRSETFNIYSAPELLSGLNGRPYRC